MRRGTKQKLYGKVRRRLMLVCAVSTGLVLIAMATVSLLITTGRIRTQQEETFLNNVNTVLYYLRNQSSISHTWMAQTEAQNDLYIGVYINDTPIMYTSQDSTRHLLSSIARKHAPDFGFDPAAPPRSLLQTDYVLFPLQVSGVAYHAAVASVPGGAHFMSVAVLKDRGPEQAELFSLRMIFIACTAVALLLLCLFAYAFSGWALRPAVESQARQTEFVAAASHELRAPLSVIQASAGALKNAPPAHALAFAEKIENECTRMARLTEDLLFTARAESAQWPLTIIPAEPETLLLSVYERFLPIARKKGVALDIGLGNDPLPRIAVDVERMEQVLAILVDNALSYTPRGGHVKLMAYAQKRSLVFSVCDDGPGIPGPQKEKIFRRFYRGDESRTDKGHFGLGLSIAHEIVTLHKGTITVRDGRYGGAEFLITLARAEHSNPQ